MSSHESETRTRILTATVEILEEHGGRGVRMSDIARRAGLSRQAVYLHFDSRADLLVAATRFLDEVLEVDKRLAPSRAASSGVERLSLYIECWGHYIPEIYAVAKALMLAQDADEAADLAWKGRMQAMKEGCAAAVKALHADGMLASGWTRPRATDFLWSLLSVPTWESLTGDCGWTNKQYVRWIKLAAQRTLIADPVGH